MQYLSFCRNVVNFSICKIFQNWAAGAPSSFLSWAETSAENFGHWVCVMLVGNVACGQCVFVSDHWSLNVRLSRVFRIYMFGFDKQFLTVLPNGKWTRCVCWWLDGSLQILKTFKTVNNTRFYSYQCQLLDSFQQFTFRIKCLCFVSCARCLLVTLFMVSALE